MVDRLYSDPRAKEARVGEAASYQQYQELKACTFKPEINREIPKQQVCINHLGTRQQLVVTAAAAGACKRWQGAGSPA